MIIAIALYNAVQVAHHLQVVRLPQVGQPEPWVPEELTVVDVAAVEDIMAAVAAMASVEAEVGPLILLLPYVLL